MRAGESVAGVAAHPDAPAQRPHPIGDVIAGYRIESVLGRGGMGVVYRATQLRLERLVALKVLAPEVASDDAFRRRFESECRLAASIDHPNVIPLYEAGETDDGLLFLSMRLVDGVDLRQHLHARGMLDSAETVHVLGQVASALDAAHARGLVHRDVKPANILLEPAPGGSTRCYLGDFGLTRRVSSDSGLTVSGQFVGTLAYVAPEQIRGQAVDARTDVYALGCVLFEALTGRPPHVRDADVGLIWAHMEEAPPSLHALRPDLPVGIDQVVSGALAKDPQQRYASCGDLIAAFEAAVGPAAVTQAHPVPTGGPPRRRSTAMIAAALVALIVAVAAITFAISGGSDGEDVAHDPPDVGQQADTRGGGNSQAAAPECSKGSAATELRREASFGPENNVASLICQDFTGDGVEDMAITRGGGGNSGTDGWFVFVAAEGRWQSALSKIGELSVALRPAGNDLERAVPVFEPSDPECCPTGGWKIERWHWNGTEFKLARSYTDPDTEPPDGFGFGGG